MQNKELIVSDEIASFLDILDNSKKQYDYSYEMVGRMDKLQCDILHKIELDCNYDQRCVAATELKRCLDERRVNKNAVEIYEPLRKWVVDNPRAISTLREVLGQIRKTEKYHASREYRKRITEPVIFSKKSKRM